MPIEQSLWYTLSLLLRQVDDLYLQTITPLELNVLEWHLLQVLYRQDGQHASTLAHAVGRAPTSFTPLLDKLEHKGLIERRPDPSDRRAVLIYLTPQAQALREAVQQSAQKVEAQLQSLVSAEDRKTLQRILDSLQGHSEAGE